MLQTMVFFYLPGCIAAIKHCCVARLYKRIQVSKVIKSGKIIVNDKQAFGLSVLPTSGLTVQVSDTTKSPLLQKPVYKIFYFFIAAVSVFTDAPSLRFCTPCTAIVCPSCKPTLTITFAPSCLPSCTFCCVTLLLSPTT
ncbi:hypothetical protein BH11BAC6_BH11BAC6_16810 [soil metagenome]